MEDFTGPVMDPSRVCAPPCPVSSIDASFKLDEGYSEETRSQYDGDSTMGIEPRSAPTLAIPMSSLHVVPEAIMSLSEDERSEYVYNILQTLRTSSISAIVERLRPRLHIDPLTRLPPEITSQMFSYLAPPMLLQASNVSKLWRGRTLESRLWKELFISEGWSLNLDEIAKFEQRLSLFNRGLKKTLSRKAENHGGQRQQKRRAREGSSFRSDESPTRVSQTSTVGSSETLTRKKEDDPTDDDFVAEDPPEPCASDEEMPDATYHPSDFEVTRADDMLDRTPKIHAFAESHVRTPAARPPGYAANDVDTLVSSISIKKPQSLLASHFGCPRLDHHQVYKQRRRLEENWSAGKFTSFQLPHRDHPEEAHTECVYTIQYSRNHLVSGSRDRTLRIWNLDTQRLIRKPLVGHNGSVLCLQFDDSEKEDVIVSGSSDTDVIVWQFSTGKMIKKISRAHRESVLNLKFDERFLVTCSKDKTIKIWSRQELRPGDENYPIKGLPGGGKCPAYIIDLSTYASPQDMDEHLTPKQKQHLQKYTALMIIDSHGAAVNAVHIQDDQLVSASGDRSLMIWNIHSGVRTGICMGHKKGIACVQYDGKRIVSGSSDETIRIFDAATAAEVACLDGHGKLVRTIQAAFGDIPGAREDLEREAQLVDRSYFEARRSGALPAAAQGRRRMRDQRLHFPGSRRPDDIRAVGAKLPPGGGGSKWARIVSGSYDETIIVWKKAADGSWMVGHRLNQAEALRAAGGPLVARSELVLQANQMAALQHHTHGPLVLPQGVQTHAQSQVAQPSNQNVQQMQVHLSAQQVVHQAMQTGAAALQVGLQNVAALQTQLNNNYPNQSNQLVNTDPTAANAQLQMGAATLQAGLHNVATLHHQLNAVTNNHTVHTHPALQAAQLQAVHIQLANQMQHPQQLHYQQQLHLQHQQAHQQVHTQPHGQQQQVANAVQGAPVNPPAGHAQVAHGHVAHGQVQPGSHPNARVFKLQFDARRLICCSQDPKIVGWDFANGDEEIIECSAFFAPPT